MAAIDDVAVKNELFKVLKETNLEVTRKQARLKVQERLGGIDLVPYKAKIKSWCNQYREELEQDSEDEAVVPVGTKRKRTSAQPAKKKAKISPSEGHLSWTPDKDGNKWTQLHNGKKRITVKTWSRKKYVDLRAFYDADGSMKPTKKGTSLRSEEWQFLKDNANEVGNKINSDEVQNEDNLSWTTDSDGNKWAQIQSAKKRITVKTFKGKQYVDVRAFYDANGTMKPTKKGISLTVDEWNFVVDNFEEITNTLDSL